MGHQTHIGFVETQVFGGAVLFRIDQPAIEGVEETLERSEWVGDICAPAGSVVKRGDIPAASVLVGAASIYRIIPCDEAAAMKAIRASVHRSLLLVKLNGAAQITAADVARAQVDDDDEEQEDYMEHVATAQF